MNTLKIYPKSLRLLYEQNIKNAGIEKSPENYHNSIALLILVLTVVFSSFFLLFGISLLYSLIVLIFLSLFFYFKMSLKASERIQKMEEVFPDAISLMASNLRSGITIERAFLLAARPEFAPLDEQMLSAGKEISTGKDVLISLKKMGENINSEKISQVVTLITSGLRAGGNIADLLEQTSRNMKEKEIIEKKTASTILMYVIFIFVAVSVGAPVLFALSSVLVEIVITLAERAPELTAAQSNLPFSFSEVPISVNFVVYFSLAFIIVTDFISTFVIGIVNKGEGKAGLKYFIPILVASLTIFFIVRKVISGILIGAISNY